NGGGWFLDDLVADPANRDQTIASLWELVWAGRVTADSFAPVRAKVQGTRAAPRRASRTRTVRIGARRRGIGSLRGPAPVTVAGRWSMVSRPELSATEQVADAVLGLLDRYGVVT